MRIPGSPTVRIASPNRHPWTLLGEWLRRIFPTQHWCCCDPLWEGECPTWSPSGPGRQAAPGSWIGRRAGLVGQGGSPLWPTIQGDLQKDAGRMERTVYRDQCYTLLPSLLLAPVLSSTQGRKGARGGNVWNHSLGQRHEPSQEDDSPTDSTVCLQERPSRWNNKSKTCLCGCPDNCQQTVVRDGALWRWGAVHIVNKSFRLELHEATGTNKNSHSLLTTVITCLWRQPLHLLHTDAAVPRSSHRGRKGEAQFSEWVGSLKPGPILPPFPLVPAHRVQRWLEQSIGVLCEIVFLFSTASPSCLDFFCEFLISDTVFSRHFPWQPEGLATWYPVFQ